MVLSLALAIIIIDTTILNVSLAAILKDFKTEIQSIQWVITAYSLTLAALTITGGRLGDLFGRKRMFVFGAIIFAIGSFIASISQNVPQMILGESIIEGVGAALMMPATASLLISTFTGRDRAMAFGVWGGIAAASAAVGPILGGFLTTYYTWRWGFRVNVFVAAALVLGSFIIKESRDTKEKPTIDWIGVLLSALGLTSLVFGIIEASAYGWWKAKMPFVLNISDYVVEASGNISFVPFAILIGILLLAAFVVWELHMDQQKKTPLVSMKLFTNQQFRSGVLTTLVLSLAQSGLIFAIPVFLQAVRGYDALQTGFSLLPMSLTILVTAPLSAILSRKIKPKYLIQLGLVCDILSFVVFWFMLNVNTSSTDLIPGFMLFGAGMGLVMAQLSNMTLSAVQIHEAGEASGVNNTLRQVGQTFGSAIIGTVLISALSANLVSGIKASNVIPEQMKSIIAEKVSTQVSDVEFSGKANVSSEIPKQIQDEIVKISHQATVDANKKSFIYGALFGLLGLLVSFALPNIALVERKTIAGGH